MIFFTQRIQNRSGKASLCCTGLPAEYCNRTFLDGQRRIRDHQSLIKFHLISEPQTIRTGSERIVKRKTSRLNLINADPAVRTGKALAEVQIVSIHRIYHQQSVRQCQHALNRIRQTLFYPRFYRKPVHHDSNRMFDILIQFYLFRQFVHIAIDLHPYITASLCLIQYLFMTSLSSSHNRCQQLDPGTFRQFHNLIHHLIHRLLCDNLPTLRAMRDTDSRIQQTKVIVDLRHRSHRRTRVSVCRLLINRNCR